MQACTNSVSEVVKVLRPNLDQSNCRPRSGWDGAVSAKLLIAALLCQGAPAASPRKPGASTSGSAPRFAPGPVVYRSALLFFVLFSGPAGSCFLDWAALAQAQESRKEGRGGSRTGETPLQRRLRCSQLAEGGQGALCCILRILQNFSSRALSFHAFREKIRVQIDATHCGHSVVTALLACGGPEPLRASGPGVPWLHCRGAGRLLAASTRRARQYEPRFLANQSEARSSQMLAALSKTEVPWNMRPRSQGARAAFRSTSLRLENPSDEAAPGPGDYHDGLVRLSALSRLSAMLQNAAQGQWATSPSTCRAWTCGCPPSRSPGRVPESCLQGVLSSRLPGTLGSAHHEGAPRPPSGFGQSQRPPPGKTAGTVPPPAPAPRCVFCSDATLGSGLLGNFADEARGVACVGASAGHVF